MLSSVEEADGEMKRSTLELMCCPECHGAISWSGAPDAGVVDEGDLLCSKCERSYPITDGIPRFISMEELGGLNLRFARFYRWYSRFEPFISRLSRSGMKEVLDRLELDGGRILEVAIGTGGNLPYLFRSPDAGEVYGLDISPEQLRGCQKFVKKRGWPADLFLGMAEALPFKAESFDTVFQIGGINFFSDKKRAIDEMIRVARPGSKIVIADESEQVARNIARLFRLSRWTEDGIVDTSVPVHLVPDTMEEVRVEGIWRRHGHDHGYCLEFRKPK